MLSMMPMCIPRQHPKRFESQTGNRPRNRVNSKMNKVVPLDDLAALIALMYRP